MIMQLQTNYMATIKFIDTTSGELDLKMHLRNGYMRDKLVGMTWGF